MPAASARHAHAARQRVQEHLIEIRRAGYDHVRIVGTGDVADICRLTCLEQGLKVVEDENIPALYVDGFKVQLLIEAKV